MGLEWQRDGVVVVPAVISHAEAQTLAAEVAAASTAIPRHGIRNAETLFGGVKALSCDPSLLEMVAGYLGDSPKLVRAIFFDKTPEANWLVTWHQDRTIAVNRRVDLEGWGPWSLKDGVHHVQPPLDVLNQMVTVRIHLDPADEANGCLRVIPGSHRSGIIRSADVAEVTRESDGVSCNVEVGDAVVMRPHILHASSKSEQPVHRRVVHLEYACCELPMGLDWV